MKTKELCLKLNCRFLWKNKKVREKNVGAPGAIRTPDPLVRSQILYPTELRAPTKKEVGIIIE